MKTALNIYNKSMKCLLKAVKLNFKGRKEYLLITYLSIFRREKKIEDHLNLYNKAHVALDTFPYPGVTTSYEAIVMGVPVLTMQGFNFNSRCGESILINSNLKDLVAKNKDDYISKVVSLANDIDRLKKIRKFIFDEVLKTNTFNTKKFAGNFWKSILDTYTNHK